MLLRDRSRLGAYACPTWLGLPLGGGEGFLVCDSIGECAVLRKRGGLGPATSVSVSVARKDVTIQIIQRIQRRVVGLVWNLCKNLGSAIK